MQNYTTQMDAARKGIVTPEMEIVAKKEYRTTEEIRQLVAEGIHVGQEDMAAAQVRQRVGDEMMIGVSVHSVEEALEAVRHGADCLGVGAAFSTHTKADVDVLPEGMMKAICDAVDIPVVAIGGIHKENLLRLKGTGVNGVALVSAIFGAEDIEAECRELKALAEQL